MRITRPFRIVAALCAIASLLFMQLAVAAYSCPEASMSPAAASAQVDSGCEGMGQANPALCYAHCVEQAQSIEKPTTHSVLPAPVTSFHVVYEESRSCSFVSAHGRQPLLARGTAPPLAIRNCCLRI